MKHMPGLKMYHKQTVCVYAIKYMIQEDTICMYTYKH